MKVIYLVYEPGDYNEGNVPSQLNSVFSYKEDAVKFIDKQSGVQGRKAKWSEEKYGDWYIKEFAMFESLEEVENKIQEEMIKTIEKKLTPEEMFLLRCKGLSLK